MESIYRIFEELSCSLADVGNGYQVASLPFIENHRLGLSETGYPTFFINTPEGEKNIFFDVNLEIISVKYDVHCQLTAGSTITEGCYSIISLNSESRDLQEYFVEVAYLILKKLPPFPKASVVRIEIEKIIDLFSQLSMPPTKSIQGLWAELLVIDCSDNVDYLVNSWHSSEKDLFDFNDGQDKIEVKSTSGNKRIHHFSIGQLNPNLSSELLIASVYAIRTGIGKNIFDLVADIYKKLTDKELIYKVNQIISLSLGESFERAFEVRFDYKLAEDSLLYYRGSEIPGINSNCIPTQVSNVHFDCDLSHIKPVSTLGTSKLHNYLRIK